MSGLAEHSRWAQQFRARADKKSFRIVDPKGDHDVSEIDISILPNQAQAGGSTAEATGWMVSVVYTNAPSVTLFTQTYPTEDLARKVLEDLSAVAAEVEGLLRAEKFDEAGEKTQALLEKFKANSGQPPVEEIGGPQ
jgi:hypothetical protein